MSSVIVTVVLTYFIHKALSYTLCISMFSSLSYTLCISILVCIVYLHFVFNGNVNIITTIHVLLRQGVLLRSVITPSVIVTVVLTVTLCVSVYYEVLCTSRLLFVFHFV